MFIVYPEDGQITALLIWKHFFFWYSPRVWEGKISQGSILLSYLQIFNMNLRLPWKCIISLVPGCIDFFLFFFLKLSERKEATSSCQVWELVYCLERICTDLVGQVSHSDEEETCDNRNGVRGTREICFIRCLGSTQSPIFLRLFLNSQEGVSLFASQPANCSR